MIWQAVTLRLTMTTAAWRKPALADGARDAPLDLRIATNLATTSRDLSDTYLHSPLAGPYDGGSLV